MTEIVYTHSFDTEYTSSVIDEVFYSEPNKLLFVTLYNGTLAGYDGVPLEVYNALNGLNTNRLNGDSNASVGRYWNTFVKNHYDGFSTADVELLSPEDVARQEKLSKLVNPTFAESFSFFNDPNNVIVGEVVTEVVDQPQDRSRFGVTFISGDKEVSINVNAVDIDDAVTRFQQVSDILGWDESPVKSVTKYFD